MARPLVAGAKPLSPKTILVVPARRASTRLADKLLLAESGQALLAHTLQACLHSKLADQVIAAVDDPELAAIADTCGVQACLTPSDLPSGSDRVWAVAKDLPEVEIVVNVQGDEPEIDPEAIDRLIAAIRDGAEVATLAAPLAPEQIEDPAAVKVVSALNGRALYFSRAAIPHARLTGGVAPRLHVGLYAYRREALAAFAGWEPTPLEKTEGLEQLRLLEHGLSLQVVDWPRSFPGIDTRQDYDRFLERVRDHSSPPS